MAARSRMFRSVSLALLLAALPSCGPEASTPPIQRISNQEGLPRGDLEIRRQSRTLLTLEVEIADTPDSQATGLMGVTELPESAGMVFFSKQPRRSPFHMKDTLIPLDIAFWDAEGRIVDILQMDPCTREPCTLYHSISDYVGALEVEAGLLDSNGVRVGDLVTLRRRS